MYRWVEHTGEVELWIEAATEKAVFADALGAFAELAADDGGGSGPVRREVVLPADDRELLLVDWLNELVYLADADGFVPERLADLELDGGKLRAVLEGHEGEPQPLVKAVTLHGLRYEGDDEGGWLARVVLDV